MAVKWLERRRKNMRAFFCLFEAVANAATATAAAAVVIVIILAYSHA